MSVAERINLVSKAIPSTTTATDYDSPVTLPGVYELKELHFSPDTTAALSGTNFSTITVETMDVVGNLVACVGVLTNETVPFTVGTSRSVALTDGTGNTATIVNQGDTVRVAITEDGTGATIHGLAVVTAEKVG